MKVSVHVGRWMTSKAAIAIAGALAIGGAVGSAVAISPTIDPPITWQGGVNIVQFSIAADTARLAYTVPAGNNFMLTDLVIATNNKNNPATLQHIYTGVGASCSNISAGRTSYLSVPTGGTLHLPFVTGIGFGPGQTVCLFNGDASITTHWTIRGFLFTAAPAS